RELTLQDFEGIVAGTDYMEIYNRVGAPDEYYYFEYFTGSRFSLIYYLSDGGRIAFNSRPDAGFGCFERMGYSPDASGSNWQVLSEDVEGKCDR
ncbi:MAG: hypothetical protein GXP40_07240, partial [Chloroflexi bacterium]|nr:hypothetical protein [Chloroflexota bacterium]